jgi:transposase
MPKENLSMRKIREVLRLKWQQGRSNREIAVSCQVSSSTVHVYLRRAVAAGLSWPQVDALDDEQLEACLYPAPRDESGMRQPPDCAHIARELRRKGVTLRLLWEEYRRVHLGGYGYSQFCRIYEASNVGAEARMRQVHRPGERLFVDYSGLKLGIVDTATGELREAEIFVATLGYSNYTFAEASWGQSLEEWIGSHVRAFNFLGGVPEIVVPDNLKSGVTKACYYEPDLNPSYQEMAQYYGVAVVPTRPEHPRDKAKVEKHVQEAQRRILAPLRDRRFLSLAEANAAMCDLVDHLNDRPFSQLPGTRRQLFQEIEAPQLRPLPTTPFSFALWKKARVNIDYHVAVERCFYSVPYTLVRHEVEVRLSQRMVEIFHKRRRVASHARKTRPGDYSTTADHMPAAHRAYAEWTPERLVRWAAQAGPQTAAAVHAILARHVHPQQGFRSCMGLIRLAKQYGPARLEAACAHSLKINSPCYGSVASILQRGLDIRPPTSEPAPAVPDHANVRGAAYYQAALALETQSDD